jgi:hypothetical protein
VLWVIVLTEFQNLVLFDHIISLKYDNGVVEGVSLRIGFKLKVSIVDVNPFYIEFSGVELVFFNKLLRNEFNDVSDCYFVIVLESDHMRVCNDHVFLDKAANALILRFLLLVVSA